MQWHLDFGCDIVWYHLWVSTEIVSGLGLCLFICDSVYWTASCLWSAHCLVLFVSVGRSKAGRNWVCLTPQQWYQQEQQELKHNLLLLFTVSLTQSREEVSLASSLTQEQGGLKLCPTAPWWTFLNPSTPHVGSSLRWVSIFIYLLLTSKKFFITDINTAVLGPLKGGGRGHFWSLVSDYLLKAKIKANPKSSDVHRKDATWK